MIRAGGVLIPRNCTGAVFKEALELIGWGLEEVVFIWGYVVNIPCFVMIG
jgi:hypothetical protein